jgi:hypothetical protein
MNIYNPRLHQKQRHRTQLNGLYGNSLSMTQPQGSNINKQANKNPTPTVMNMLSYISIIIFDLCIRL